MYSASAYRATTATTCAATNSLTFRIIDAPRARHMSREQDRPPGSAGTGRRSVVARHWTACCASSTAKPGWRGRHPRSGASSIASARKRKALENPRARRSGRRSGDGRRTAEQVRLYARRQHTARPQRGAVLRFSGRPRWGSGGDRGAGRRGLRCLQGLDDRTQAQHRPIKVGPAIRCRPLGQQHRAQTGRAVCATHDIARQRLSVAVNGCTRHIDRTDLGQHRRAHRVGRSDQPRQRRQTRRDQEQPAGHPGQSCQ